MKYLLSFFILCLFTGCMNVSGAIDDTMQPFMKINYPKASYETKIEGAKKTFVIHDKGNTITKGKEQPLIKQTVGQFFVSFYNANIPLKDSVKLQVIYKAKAYTYKSKIYTLPQLKETFSIHFK